MRIPDSTAKRITSTSKTKGIYTGFDLTRKTMLPFFTHQTTAPASKRLLGQGKKKDL